MTNTDHAVKATLLDNNRIGVRGPAGEPDTYKSILGARWSKAQTAWTYPATVETCEALRGTFGEALVVLPRLRDWYTTAATQRAAQADLMAAGDATLAHLAQRAPRLAATLRPDQRAGALAIANGYEGSILVADEPGLGKTLETIAGVIEGGFSGNRLVICPKLSVKNVWYKELTKWADDPVHMARGTRAQREKAIAAFHADKRENKWLIIVAEMLRIKEKPDPRDPSGKKMLFDGYEFPELFENSWGAVVVDESHKLFGSLTVVKGNLMGKGIKRLPVLPSGRRIAVSGTPFGKGGRVQGMFGTLHWLWPKEFTSFWRWAERHFEIEEKQINRFGKTVKKIHGLKQGTDSEEFLHSLGPRILRRKKEEVLKWLPAKNYIEVLCEMGPKQKKQYELLTSDGEITGPGGMMLVNGALAELTRAKQAANGVLDIQPSGKPGEDDKIVFTGESCKIDMLFEKLDTRGILTGEGDMKVIVASQYNEFLAVVMKRFDEAGVAYHVITGATSDRARDRAMDEFQAEGGARVMILNSKAGGISITLDAADEAHCLDEMWSPEDNAQLEDRIHRASRNHQATILYYRTEGTIDQHIAEDVEGKRFEQFRVLDGRRGLSYMREMIQYRKGDTE